MSEIVGDIEYVIKANTDALLKGNKQVDKYLSQLQSSFDGADKAAGGLEGSLKQAGSAIDDTSDAAVAMSRNVAAVEGAVGKLNTNINSLTRAILESRSGVSSASSEFSRAESIIESLGNQLAILEEQQEGSGRSAAILAAQLRAGSNATEEEKKTIADLTGRLYDMKNSTEAGAKGTKNWKSTMQQAGYQVNDFIVQVQGGQSALVAFSQQGSQLAGAFGPGGAVIGAVIALGSIIAGTLITSLNGGKNAMDALKDAAESMDKVITISNQGVAALSDKYAALARTNANVATVLRNQALLEYNQAIAKIPKAISDASDSFITLGDRAIAAFGGASPSIKKFNEELTRLGATSTDWYQAIQQANSQGQYATGVVSSLSATVNTLSSRMGISKQAAFELAKQLSDLSNNPSPEALQEVIKGLQGMSSSTKDGQGAITGLVGSLKDLWVAALDAKQGVDSVAKATDNLTMGQKNLIQQSERTLALSKLQGEARARLQAQYAAEDAGFAKDDPHAKRMEDDAAATYRNTQAQKDLQSQQKKGASQAESIAQKLERLKQQSDLAADSTKELSREQAVLAAQQSLGKGATQEQIALAGKYRGEIWDTANALKAQAAAEKLLPEARENASYQDDVEDLKTALAAKKISQEQFNETSLRIEQQHQANLAKIRAQQAVTPQQSAIGEIDPVQQLANQHAQELALIQQFETQKGQITQRGLELMNAANTEYEQARIAAQWEIYRNQSTTNQLMADAVDSLQGGATNAITGLINGTQSLQESLANIGTTILNSVVGGFVQMGVEWVKSQLMGQAAAATSLASTMAQATAAASAWAPAAMSASIATYGSAAAIGQAAYAESMVAAKGLALAGGRRYGGTVSAGNAYRINEDGRSEIFQTAGGQQAFIPNQSGKIIPADKAGGGGSFNPVMNLTINTTGGIGNEEIARLRKVWNNDMLKMMVDQSTRPNGLLQGRRK